MCNHSALQCILPISPDSFRIKYFNLAHKPFLRCSFSWLAHFRCSSVIADSSVVQDMLINLLLNLTTCYSLCLPRTCIISNICLPSFDSFHPFINFPLFPTVIATLNCHSSVNFATLTITVSDCFSLVHSVSESSHLSCYNIITIQKTMNTK